MVAKLKPISKSQRIAPSEPTPLVESAPPVKTVAQQVKEKIELKQEVVEEKSLADMEWGLDDWDALLPFIDFKLEHKSAIGRGRIQGYDLQLRIKRKAPLAGGKDGNEYRISFGKYFKEKNLHFNSLMLGEIKYTNKSELLAAFDVDHPTLRASLDNIEIRKNSEKKMLYTSSWSLAQKLIVFFGLTLPKVIDASVSYEFIVRPIAIKGYDQSKTFIIEKPESLNPIDNGNE